MSTLPEPTPLPEEIGHWVCRVNELVRLRFPTDPEGLVAELQENPKNPDGLDARNECGWTALMRSARDGLKHHVVALASGFLMCTINTVTRRDSCAASSQNLDRINHS